MSNNVEPSRYILNGDTNAGRWFGWCKTVNQGRVSFQVKLPASASRAGTLNVYCSDDPAAQLDNQKLQEPGGAGSDVFSSLQAFATKMTLPAGSVHIDSTSGTVATWSADSTDIAVAAGAGTVLINLENPAAFVALRYHTPTAGAVDEMQAYRSGC